MTLQGSNCGGHAAHVLHLYGSPRCIAPLFPAPHPKAHRDCLESGTRPLTKTWNCVTLKPWVLNTPLAAVKMRPPPKCTIALLTHCPIHSAPKTLALNALNAHPHQKPEHSGPIGTVFHFTEMSPLLLWHSESELALKM